MANDLFAKLEARIKAVVDGLGLASGVTVNTGSSADTLEPPYVMCAVEAAPQEVHHNVNVWEVSAKVSVGTNADDETLATHRARVATVFDAFRQDNLASTLSDATEGVGVQFVHSTTLESEQLEREWVDTISFTLIAGPEYVS